MSDLPQADGSRRVPFRVDETWQERHARRLRVALDDRHRLEGKLAGLKHRISILNGGSHWRVRCRGRMFEWWPESGRVVLDQKWDRAKKAHDVDQLATMIVRIVK
jgi:hypothetical protein